MTSERLLPRANLGTTNIPEHQVSMKVQQLKLQSWHELAPIKEIFKLPGSSQEVLASKDQRLHKYFKMSVRITMACVACKQRKSRCTGAPAPCTACVARGTSCVIDETLDKRRKASAHRLEERVSRQGEVFNALIQCLQHGSSKEIEELVTSLRNNDSEDHIAALMWRNINGLDDADPSRSVNVEELADKFSERPSLREATDNMDTDNTEKLKSQTPDLEGLQHVPPYTETKVSSLLNAGLARLGRASRQQLLGQENPSTPGYPASEWTEVTTNDALVEHLVGLYFCWEYPTFTGLSKEHFLLDYHSGTFRFCSPLLVNAILALGAKSSDRPEARMNPDDPDSAGDHFFAEAQRLFGLIEIPSIPTVQALNLMSLRQASCGNDASGNHFARLAMRMALDMDLHRDKPHQAIRSGAHYSVAESQVRIATFWGCFALEQVWSMCIGRLPQLRLNEVDVKKPLIIKEIEEEEWIPYWDNSFLGESNSRQRSNLQLVFKSFTELSELNNIAQLAIYDDEQQLDGDDVIRLYTTYLRWYESLPDPLRRGSDSTPTVLFIHPCLYFHFSILKLFLPFSSLKSISNKISPQSICLEASGNVLSLVSSYRRLYTLRRVPAMTPYLVLYAELAQMKMWWYSNQMLSEPKPYTSKGVEYLEEIAFSHGFARRAISLCRFFKECWEIEFSDREPGAPISESTDDDHKSELTLPHGKTFLRPDEDLDLYREEEPDVVSHRKYLQGTFGFSIFPFQYGALNLLGTMDERTDVSREASACTSELQALGFELK